MKEHEDRKNLGKERKDDMKKRFIPVLVFIIACMMCSSVFARGNWKINKKTSSYLTAGEKTDFNEALKGFSGVSYTPVFRIADQVVAGKNTAYFCKAVTVTKKPVTSWKIVIINRDLSGKSSILRVNDFDFQSVKTLNSQYDTKTIPGGWEYNKNSYPSKVLPQSARKVFQKAKKKYVGVDLTALTLLGTQAVNGKNYRYLCQGKSADKEGTVCLYVVDVLQKTSGKCSITNCDVIDVPGYLG